MAVLPGARLAQAAAEAAQASEDAAAGYAEQAANAIVSSVNGQTGDVVLDADNIDDASTAHKFATEGQLEKVDHLTVTQAVDLDALETKAALVTVTQAVDLDAMETKLAGIETAADVTDAGNVGSSIHGATAKTTPVDADTLPLIDSAASNVLKKVTWANVKATLKTYFDTLYQPLATALTSWSSVTRASGFDTFVATPSSANLRSLLTDEVGTGNAYFTGGALGTPASGTATNLTGLPLSTGVTGTLPLANGGTGASLTDPNADRLFFWDDSAGSTAFLTLGTGLSITGTTLDASGGSGVPAGGTTGQILAKQSNADGDADWETPIEETVSTFTPSLRGESTAGTPTYATGGQYGIYHKLGRLVTYTIRLHLAVGGKGGATGNIRITGLPFTVHTTASNEFWCGQILFSYVDFPAGYTQGYAITRQGTTEISLGFLGDNVTTTALTATHLDDSGTTADTSVIYVTGSYITD
jgi:hypothetical protein